MAEEEILILDASVAVKWFNPEPLRDKALEIRDSFVEGRVQLEAPTLLPYELTNVLRYNPRFGIEEVKASLKALEDLQLTLHEFQGDLAENAVEMAYRLEITVYDATYVSLALLRGGVLYTADYEVVGKASTDKVLHLSEFKA
jgi:predicted nucleic acid-binding protein